jgi:hypothetical protein
MTRSAVISSSQAMHTEYGSTTDCGKGHPLSNPRGEGGSQTRGHHLRLPHKAVVPTAEAAELTDCTLATDAASDFLRQLKEVWPTSNVAFVPGS